MHAAETLGPAPGGQAGGYGYRPIRAAEPAGGGEGCGTRTSTPADLLMFVRRRIAGDYAVDEFGFDPHLNDHVLMALARVLYYHWFEVEVRGTANLPAGAALVVANHSGTVPLDALMTQVALLDRGGRHLRMLGADLVYSLPVLSHLARKSGHTLACPSDAQRLLDQGEVVGVWPEGFKGVGKLFSERYRLQRFGRGGFVVTALRSGAPIVPCSIVGAEETYPMLADLKVLARVLGLPYFPITPTFPLLGPLGLVPLPTRWIIEFGEPIPTAHLDAPATEDPELLLDMSGQVRETIQHSLHRLLPQRGAVFR